MHDIKFLSRYPFLKEAKEYIERKNLSMDTIAKSPIYGSAINVAIERIINGINGKSEYSPLMPGDVGYEIYLISFPLSKIFLSLAEVNKNLKQKYAKSEGMLFESYVKKENEKVKIQILNEILNFSYVQKDKYTIYFVDYLFYTKNLRDEKFHLINRRVNNSFVEVNENELITITKDILGKKYTEALNLSDVNPPDIIVEKAKLLKDKIKEIETEISPRIGVKFKTYREMPPSIAHIIQKIENKEKITHNERFVLASFLISKQTPVEEIKKTFSHALNYDEKKTAYYLDYLSKRKYTCPSYSTMRSLGLWVSDEEEKFKNPLAYRKIKI